MKNDIKDVSMVEFCFQQNLMFDPREWVDIQSTFISKNPDLVKNGWVPCLVPVLATSPDGLSCVIFIDGILRGNLTIYQLNCRIIGKINENKTLFFIGHIWSGQMVGHAFPVFNHAVTAVDIISNIGIDWVNDYPMVTRNDDNLKKALSTSERVIIRLLQSGFFIADEVKAELPFEHNLQNLMLNSNDEDFFNFKTKGGQLTEKNIMQ